MTTPKLLLLVSVVMAVAAGLCINAAVDAGDTAQGFVLVIVGAIFAVLAVLIGAAADGEVE